MNYKKFKEQFAAQFRDYLPAMYTGWMLEISEMPKVNGYREAVTLRPETGAGCTPVLYLDELYDYYRHCKDFTSVVQKAAAIFVLGIDHASRRKSIAARELPKESVIFVLASEDGNDRLLNNVPHRMTLDLALLYRVCVETEDGGFDSAIITYDLAKEMGLSEEDLYALAVENTPRILPLQTETTEDCFTIITNKKATLGAAAMMYPGVLGEIANKMDANLFILPASIHEVFTVPDVGQSVEEMNQIVKEANQHMDRKDEFLSSHVYYYRRDCDKVFIPSAPIGS